jgi:hypothetical protein
MAVTAGGTIFLVVLDLGFKGGEADIETVRSFLTSWG